MTPQLALKTMAEKPFAFDPATIAAVEKKGMISTGMIEGILAENWAASAKAEGHRQRVPETTKPSFSRATTPLAERALAVMREAGRPVTVKFIRVALNCDYQPLYTALLAMDRNGLVRSDKGQRYQKWEAVR